MGFFDVPASYHVDLSPTPKFWMVSTSQTKQSHVTLVSWRIFHHITFFKRFRDRKVNALRDRPNDPGSGSDWTEVKKFRVSKFVIGRWVPFLIITVPMVQIGGVQPPRYTLMGKGERAANRPRSVCLVVRSSAFPSRPPCYESLA